MSDTTPAQAANPEPQAGEGQQIEPEQAQSGQAGQQWTLDAALAEIGNLRKEAAKYRKERETAIKQAEADKAAQLAEQGKYRELYEQAAAKLAEVGPLQERMAAITEATQAANEKRIAAIPEHMRTLVPEYGDPFQLAAWLDANAAVFAKPTPPPLDGRAGQGGQPAPVIATDEEVKAYAARWGVDPQYVDRAIVAKLRK